MLVEPREALLPAAAEPTAFDVKNNFAGDQFVHDAPLARPRRRRSDDASQSRVTPPRCYVLAKFGGLQG
jgi:hypothetical protein